MINVKDKLATHGYDNKLPYPHGSIRSNRDEHEAFRAETRRLQDEFRLEALEFVGLKDHRLAGTKHGATGTPAASARC